MASRDLTSSFIEKRTSFLKRRNGHDNNSSLMAGGSKNKSNRLTAGGSDNGHSLMLMEVRKWKLRMGRWRRPMIPIWF